VRSPALDISGTSITIGANSITTTGAQSYLGPTTILAGATLTTAGGAVTFKGAENGFAAASVISRRRQRHHLDGGDHRHDQRRQCRRWRHRFGSTVDGTSPAARG